MHEEFQTVLRAHLARYPLMEPQDCAKLAYQSTFGPAHAAGERGDVLRQLLGECSALPADREARPPERIGNGLCRVHLSGTGDWTLAAPLRADLLLLPAAEHHGTAADLEECLTAAEALPLPGMAGWLAVGAPAGSRSAQMQAWGGIREKVTGISTFSTKLFT